MAGESIDALRRALAAGPASADLHGRLGAALLADARARQADALARRAAPSADAPALYAEALEHFRSAARLRPDSAQALRSCGIVLRELGRLGEALACFEQARRLDPADSGLAADHAGALQHTGDTAGAVRAFERALAQHPDDATLHAAFALTLLGAGDYARGWDEYEWRLRSAEAAIERPFPFPRWQGEPLEGRTLLVYSEQGIGDEIMFASCFDELVARAAYCVLEVSTRLAPLAARAFPRATVIERSLQRMPEWSRLPRIDCCIAAGSVPRFLRRGGADFPQRQAFLRADPARAAHWGERLAALGPTPRIGLAWTGGLPGTLRAARSLDLAALAPLIGARDATWLALEHADCSAEVERFNRVQGARLHWLPQAVATLDETAAAIAALDLVVSATTATAHLAAALGRPTWVLVPAVPSWRYQWQGERMPWYPSMRVLRGGGSREAAVALACERLRAAEFS